MRIVVQRVTRAEVQIGQEKIAEIGKGLLILLGIAEGDQENTVRQAAIKIAKMRLMADENDKMNLSVKDVAGEILVVSQFTLIADVSGGNRPSFIKAARPETAEKLYKLFIAVLKEQGLKKVATGQFGAYMKVSLDNDGPVTIVFDC